MPTHTKGALRKAVQQAVEGGPRSREEFLEYAVGELLGPDYEATEEEERELEAALEKVATEMRLNIDTGEYREPEPQAKPQRKARKPKAQAKKAQSKEPAPESRCQCGCGAPVARRFLPGHDAKLLSMLKKVERGEMTKDELQERGVDLEAMGAVRGGVR